MSYSLNLGAGRDPSGGVVRGQAAPVTHQAPAESGVTTRFLEELSPQVG